MRELNEKQVDSLQTFKVSTNSEGQINAVCSHFCEVTGWSEVELVGSNLGAYIHPNDVELYQKKLAKQSPELTPYKIRFKSNKSQFVWMDCILSYQNDTLFVKGVLMDESSLMDYLGKQLYEVSLETSDFVGLADPLGNVLFVNDAGRDMVGLDRKENIMHMKVQDFHPKWAENELYNVAIPEAIMDGVWRGRLALTTSKGEEIPVSAMIMAHKDEEGKVYRFSCILRDVRNQLFKEQLIDQQRKEYLDLFNHIHNGVLIVDPKSYYIIECNTSFLEYYTFRKKEVLDTPLTSFFEILNWTKLTGKLEAVSSGESEHETALAKLHSHHDSFDVEVFIKRYSFFNKPVLLVDINDLTEKVKKETQLKIFTQQLKESHANLSGLYERLETQSQQISEINQELIESITYAKKIQESVLFEREALNQIFPDNFVCFRPRAIVSGDFYSAYNLGDISIVAIVDCTGHGVPGAFMTIIGSMLLNKIIKDEGVTEPSEILKKLNVSVIHALNQKGVDFEARDGMDVSLVKIDKKKNELTYAGANRNLLYVQNGELKKWVASRISIGGFREFEKQYNSITLPLNEISRVYQFTDGLVDQFGGPRSKKYSSKRLFALLDEIKDQSLAHQKDELLKSISLWMQGESQVDDMLFVGYCPNE